MFSYRYKQEKQANSLSRIVSLILHNKATKSQVWHYPTLLLQTPNKGQRAVFSCVFLRSTCFPFWNSNLEQSVTSNNKSCWVSEWLEQTQTAQNISIMRIYESAPSVEKSLRVLHLHFTREHHREATLSANKLQDDEASDWDEGCFCQHTCYELCVSWFVAICFVR